MGVKFEETAMRNGLAECSEAHSTFWLKKKLILRHINDRNIATNLVDEYIFNGYHLAAFFSSLDLAPNQLVPLLQASFFQKGACTFK